MQVLQLLQSMSTRQKHNTTAQQSSWLAMIVKGHPNAPCAWQSEPRNSIVAQHPEHDYMVLLLPEGRMLIYALLGRGLLFSGFPKAAQPHVQPQQASTGVDQMQTDP